MTGAVASVDAGAAARAALAAGRDGPPVVVALIVATPAGGPAPGTRLLVGGDGAVTGTTGDVALDREIAALALKALGAGQAGTRAVAGCDVYLEPHAGEDELVIVGAGHIAVPLAWFADRLGFRVTVLDDREAFAGPERFPPAARVLRCDFRAPFRDVPIGPRSHVALVTRAHRYDFDCLRTLLHGDVAPRWIGMIGSRRRVRAAFGALLRAGTPRDRLRAVSAPVGLDLGAETPAEIALSIVAELVQIRRGRDGGGLRLADRARVLDRLMPAATPREAGHAR